MSIIFKRQSIRKYLDKAVEHEKIESLLKAGMQAPSATNQQPWEFLVVTDRETLRKLSKATAYSSMVADCGVALVLMASLEGLRSPRFWQQDMAAAAQNILLHATELDLGGVWIGIAPNEKSMAFVSDFFKLPRTIQPFCILSIGYPDEKRTFISRYDPSRVHYK